MQSAMTDPYDYWCKADTPQDLKDALLRGDQDRVRQWCAGNPTRLRLALECIHPQHVVYREIVQRALTSHERAEDAATGERQHRDTLEVARQANHLSRWAIV